MGTHSTTRSSTLHRLVCLYLPSDYQADVVHVAVDYPGRAPVSQQIDLPPDGTGGYPTQGQLGLGLIDYGAASIDDLVVEGIAS